MLAVDHPHGPIRRLEIIQQAGIHRDAAGLSIPTAVPLEIRTVGIEIAAAGAAEMIVNRPRIPVIDRVAVGQGHLEPVGREIGIKMPALGTEGTSATRELFGQFTFDGETVAAAVAPSSQTHGYSSRAGSNPATRGSGVRCLAARNVNLRGFIGAEPAIDKAR